MTWPKVAESGKRSQGEPGQELLDRGVPSPDREEDQVALVAADAGIGHEVRALVDAKQRLWG